MRLSPVALLFVIASFAAAHAQQAQPHAPATRSHDTPLPVTHVSLYKNGVGFFEHTGTVTGDAAVTLSFTSSQLNDVLQSLSAIDLNGGRISGAAYNSTTPLDQQLQSIPLGLPARTTYTGLFNALRGARVEVHGSGAPFTGRLVDIEEHKTTLGSDAAATIESRFATVAADTGEVRIFQISPALSIRLLDTTHADLMQYLQLLDSNRDQGFRRLTINDNGAGTRQLRVSYLSEVPIWKSTYRILFTNADTPTSAQMATVQGWSVVDNTTGADWVNVRLSLIAGAPQSFIQPLSQPIYSRRPEIPVSQEAQLTPQTHDSSMDSLSAPKVIAGSPHALAMQAENADVAATVAGVHGGLLGGTGLGPGFGGGVLRRSDGPPPPIHYPPPLVSYESSAAASLSSQTATAGFDDFFAYNVIEPVTLRKNESALVPILQAKVPAESITLVSYANGRTSQPLRALWITNTSNLTLDRGSFTMIEDGNFAGEGLAEPIHPAEKRLLSYAADQAVQVSTNSEETTSHITSIRGSRGVLTIRRAEVHEATLVIHNAASSHRTVISEVPVVNGWKLDSLTNPSSSDPKPVETTASVYRFRSDAAPGQTVNLHIGASRNGTTTYDLTRSDDDQFQLILNETHHDASLEAALQPILAGRRRVADAQTLVDRINARLADLRSDEERQRANITALQNADKTSRRRFVGDLNKTEDAITAAQAELAANSGALAAAQTDLSSRIESFQVDETL